MHTYLFFIIFFGLKHYGLKYDRFTALIILSHIAKCGHCGDIKLLATRLPVQADIKKLLQLFISDPMSWAVTVDFRHKGKWMKKCFHVMMSSSFGY